MASGSAVVLWWHHGCHEGGHEYSIPFQLYHDSHSPTTITAGSFFHWSVKAADQGQSWLCAVRCMLWSVTPAVPSRDCVIAFFLNLLRDLTGTTLGAWWLEGGGERGSSTQDEWQWQLGGGPAPINEWWLGPCPASRMPGDWWGVEHRESHFMYWCFL